MELEEVSKVEINHKGELFICLKSGGKAEYQHIYRQGREVYWDSEMKGFKSPPPRQWTYLQWYKHILDVVSEAIKLKLIISNNTEWINVDDELKKILSSI